MSLKKKEEFSKKSLNLNFLNTKCNVPGMSVFSRILGDVDPLTPHARARRVRGMEGQAVLDSMEAYVPKPVIRKLSVKEKNYISFCEQYYHIHSKLPTNEQAAYQLRYSISEIVVFLSNRRVVEAFDKRGIPWETATAAQAASYLSPIQIATAVTVANFADVRPVAAKIEQLGVNPSQYYAWLKNPTYQSFVNELADQALDNVRPEAIAAFAQLLRDGDVRALKMYFEMTGQFNDNNAQYQNLKLTLQRVVEAVAKHVQDPDILSRISAEVGLVAPVANDVVVSVPVNEIEGTDVTASEEVRSGSVRSDFESESFEFEGERKSKETSELEVQQAVKGLSGS